jgi:hypothetical protein
MPTTTALNISPALVPAVETDIIIVPLSTEYDLPVIRFVNTDVDPHQITIWNKPGAGAGTDADLEATLTIQPQSLYEHGPMVLAAGRRVSVMADVAGVVSVRPHGWSIVP